LDSPSQHVWISRPWGGGPHPSHVVAGSLERANSRAREVLIGQKSQGQAALGNTRFRAQNVTRIGQAGADVFAREARIVRQDIGLAPTVGHKADDEFDGKARSANNGLSGQDLRVKCYARGLVLRILDHARDHGRVTIGEMAKLSGGSRNTLKDDFRMLVEKRHLVRRGVGRATWYSQP
jgi:hypothetical protein